MRRVPKVWRAVALVAVLGSVLALAGPAGAATRAPEIRFVAQVVPVSPLLPDIAFVTGSYRCFGGQPIHLWVSVKQGGPDPTAEHSSHTVTSWYDTNPPGAPPPVTCNGAWQSVSVPVRRHLDKARLKAGPAWVQFCLVDEHNGLLASNSRWATVVGI
jgi:hypothetical protein